MRKADPIEAQVIAGRIEVMLVHGAYSQARRIVAAETYRLENETRLTDFEEYVYAADVPLVLSKTIEPETLNFLDDAGIITLGPLRKMAYGEVRAIDGIGEARAANAWEARHELFQKWKQAKQAMAQKKKRTYVKMAKRMTCANGLTQMVLF